MRYAPNHLLSFLLHVPCPMRVRFLVPFVLIACSEGSDEDETSDPCPGTEACDDTGTTEFSESFGVVDGVLTLGEATPISVEFGSGVAYGREYLIGFDHVVVLTQWGDSRCGDVEEGWDYGVQGYKLEVFFNDDATTATSVLWSCPSSQCDLFDYAEVDISFTEVELEVGGAVSGTAVIDGGRSRGTLDFAVTYCGDV